ncbi:MAG TPA: GIY-YIG nuclease family protein [Ignavibacteria bacterium]|nr:GIY-YIG nuclease family protein [Ignavibacteria bacterium]
MSEFGKSIRIYLKDGTVTGIKVGEVVNQTIKSISCPRLKISELTDQPDVKRPGIYFLFGQDEETSEPKVYIGEAENVFERLQEHILKKDFWNEVIFIVSKDENLTKSHVKYLESRVIELSFKIKRYKVDNNNHSTAPLLPLPDKDAMEEFLIYLKLLLGVLGHKLLEEINPTKVVEKTFDKVEYNEYNSSDSRELFLSVSGLTAKALQTDEGIVVLKGSEATQNIQGLQKGYKEDRERLIENGRLKLINDKYIFQEDTIFKSPSAAAAIIVGYSINGRKHWKDKNGKSLNEIENESVPSVNSLLRDIFKIENKSVGSETNSEGHSPSFR